MDLRHGFKVPIGLLDDLVSKLTASYWDTILRPTQGGLGGNNTDGQIVTRLTFSAGILAKYRTETLDGRGAR